MNARSERYSGSRQKEDEYRSEFQRDRDRVLYSDEFRRLSLDPPIEVWGLGCG